MEGFSIEKINEQIFARIKGKSYKDGCRIPLSDLRYLRLKHIGFDGNPHDGEMICSKYVAGAAVEIFEKLYNAGYQIEKIRLIDEYDADDERSMGDNNSSAFCYRTISYSDVISKHGYGMAIDINTLYNPYVKMVDGKLSIEPANAADFVDRSKDFPHKIDENDLCCQLFKQHGFEWGGDWDYAKDYQHFEMPSSFIKEKYPEYGSPKFTAKVKE